MDTDVRLPVVAGRFYEADEHLCRDEAHRLGGLQTPEPADLDQGRLFGGIVPHAGWVCSGRIAGSVFNTLAQHSHPTTIFLTGSVHTVDLRFPALDQADVWRTPLGDIPVDHDLRQAIATLPDFQVLDDAHRREHSLEVELPLIQTAFSPDIRIVPCMIPPSLSAPDWGKALGQLLSRWDREVLVIASTDLTHYGPNYGFIPAGRGELGYRWAHQENDARIIHLMQRMRAHDIVPETTQHHNACGGGAVAAVIAAALKLGASRGILLEHTDSGRELAKLDYHDRDNTVGYAGLVFG